MTSKLRKRTIAPSSSTAAPLAAALPSALTSASAALAPNSPLTTPHSFIEFRPYQRKAFDDRHTGTQIWLWARQTGKSFTLAAWAVDRLIKAPGRTVNILSNSKFNGSELNRKCAEICRSLRQAFEQVDLSSDDRFKNFKFETRITINGHVGRILVLPANPETARGFSGDLILDEFAFHDDSAAIWTAARPILDANKDYLCRIASTPNGKHNQFYRLVTDPLYDTFKITRTDAHQAGCQIFHPRTRQPITPAQARELESDKRAYDQNYQCVFEDQNLALLTHQLIHDAERPDIGLICDQDWSQPALAFLSGSLPVSGAGFQPAVPQVSNLLPGSLPNDQCQILNDQCPMNSASDPTPSPSGSPASNPSHITQRKTARAWLADSNPPALNRHLLRHVCGGSADRFHDLLHSGQPFALTDILNPFQPSRPLPNNKCQMPDDQCPMNFLNSSPERHLYFGVDVGRNLDRTVITVLQRAGDLCLVRAILRLANLRLPDQQTRLDTLLSNPDVRHGHIDMTGLGLGLCEYTQQKFPAKISGVNFASSLPLLSVPSVPLWLKNSPPRATVRITELLATQLLQAFEDKSIHIPIHHDLRDDLRKPERRVTATGQVSIAASRNEAGHADHFWSLALALHAAQAPVRPAPASSVVIPRPRSHSFRL